MDIVRTILIVVAAILVASVALKILAIVMAIVFNLVTIAALAALIYVGYLVARSALRRSPQ